MKLIIDAQRDGAIFAAVLRLALDAGALVESDASDPRAAGFGMPPPPLAFALSVADAAAPPIAHGAPTDISTTPVPSAPVPMPAAPAVAPSAPVPPSDSAHAGVDSHGIPWDSRIHAGTGGKNADGAWKRKKGVGDVFYNDTVAELHRVMAIPAPLASSAPVAPPVPPMTAPAPLPHPAMPSLSAPPMTPSAPPTPPSPSVPPLPSDTVTTFAQLMMLITGLMQAGRLTQAEAIAACQANQVPGLPSLAARPDLIPSVAMTVEAMAKPAA